MIESHPIPSRPWLPNTGIRCSTLMA